RVFRIGSYTVVDFNSVICPLQAIAGAGIAHADVLAEIEGIADAAVVGTQLPARDPEAEGRALIETEGAIAAAAFAAAGSPDALALAWGAQADAAALEHECGNQRAAFTAILELPWEAPSAATLANALWLTPSLRFNELYGPRQYAPRSAMAPLLARMWLAWLGFAAIGERLARRTLDLQELTTLWSEQVPLMHVVARWTDLPALKPGPAELPGVDPGGLVRSLGTAFVNNRKARKPLGDLIVALGSDATTRITALKSADALLRSAFAR
ncbi:MAG: hypothetical protein ABI867_24980, partial [Kofleriaceae bacterium]